MSKKLGIRILWLIIWATVVSVVEGLLKLWFGINIDGPSFLFGVIMIGIYLGGCEAIDSSVKLRKLNQNPPDVRCEVCGDKPGPYGLHKCGGMLVCEYCDLIN